MRKSPQAQRFVSALRESDRRSADGGLDSHGQLLVTNVDGDSVSGGDADAGADEDVAEVVLVRLHA